MHRLVAERGEVENSEPAVAQANFDRLRHSFAQDGCALIVRAAMGERAGGALQHFGRNGCPTRDNAYDSTHLDSTRFPGGSPCYRIPLPCGDERDIANNFPYGVAMIASFVTLPQNFQAEPVIGFWNKLETVQPCGHEVSADTACVGS